MIIYYLIQDVGDIVMMRKCMHSHLRLVVPRSIRENPRYAVYGEYSWAFLLEERGEKNTRLIVRTRANLGPRLYQAITMPFILV